MTASHSAAPGHLMTTASVHGVTGQTVIMTTLVEGDGFFAQVGQFGPPAGAAPACQTASKTAGQSTACQSRYSYKYARYNIVINVLGILS